MITITITASNNEYMNCKEMFELIAKQNKAARDRSLEKFNAKKYKRRIDKAKYFKKIEP